MIYVITDGQHFKIGKARNPEMRLRELQTGNARRLGIVCTWATPILTPMVEPDEIEWQDRLLELWLHAYLSEHRLTGEWFDGEAHRVKAIIEFMKGGHFDDVAMLLDKVRGDADWDTWVSSKGRGTDATRQFWEWCKKKRAEMDNLDA